MSAITNLQQAIEIVSSDPLARGCICLTAKANHQGAVEVVAAAANRYAALSRLHCEAVHDDGPVPVIAALRELPGFLQSDGNRELDAVADSIIARAALEVSA